MKITYSNKKVEKCFENYNEMKKHIPFEWTRAVKKHIDRLQAAETFGDFLQLNLGHPERLKNQNEIQYSIRVNGNVRLIIKLDKNCTISQCKEIEIEGVVDYHGKSETWYIP